MTEKPQGPFTVEHTKDEYDDEYFFVTDKNGDWISEGFPTREFAVEEIQKLEKE